MASTIYLLVSIITAVGCVYGHIELPDYIHVCKRSVPNMVECLNKSVETIRPYLIEGIPELDIPKLDPISINDLILSEKSKTNDGGVTILAKNIVVHGAAHFEVKKIETLEYGKKYRFEIINPKLYVTGQYEFDGIILLLPLKNAGKFSGNFSDCDGITTVTLEEVPQGNETHIQIKKFVQKITIGSGRLNFDNIISRNKELTQILNEAINNNFELYTKEVVPLLEKVLAKYFMKLGNKIIDRFTVDQLFPKN